jgi:tetratricopeptide (TPR) repeat protein
VVVFQNLSLPVWPVWHYAVAIGYDLGTQQIMLHSGGEERLVMSLHAFERTWARGGRWAMTVTPPQRLPAAARRADIGVAAAALERIDAPAAWLAYEAMLARWPDDRVALFGRGNALYSQGRKEDAARAWRAAVEIHPDFADAWNNLAQALLDLGRRDDARAAVAHALALGGDHVRDYQDTRAAIEAAY